MNKQPTPETDAFFSRNDIDWDMEVEFARKLERERDEAREALRSCVECLKGWKREFPELPAPFTEAALWDAGKILEAAK